MYPLRIERPLSEFTYIPESIRTPNAIVHLQYEYGKEPPKPSQGQWTCFVCLSDTHCSVCPVPDGDVLLHSGDLTDTGTIEEVKGTMEWLCGLKHKVKIIIAGNHDLTFHHEWYGTNWRRWHDEREDENAIMELVKGPAAKEAGIVYLNCEKYQFSVGGKTWSVYGSPWQPAFCNWAFNYKRNQAHVIVDKIPNVDILLTHGPPYGVLDETTRKLKVGCETLSKRLPQLQPRLHLFGHIHEAHGAHIHTWDDAGLSPIARLFDAIKNRGNQASEPPGQTVFVNASNLSSPSYGGKRVPFGGPGFQPVIVDLKDEY